MIRFTSVLSIPPANATLNSSRVIPIVAASSNPFASDTIQVFTDQNRLYQFCQCAKDLPSIFQSLQQLCATATAAAAPPNLIACPDCACLVSMLELSKHLCEPTTTTTPS